MHFLLALHPHLWSCGQLSNSHLASPASQALKAKLPRPPSPPGILWGHSLVEQRRRDAYNRVGLSENTWSLFPPREAADQIPWACLLGCAVHSSPLQSGLWWRTCWQKGGQQPLAGGGPRALLMQGGGDSLGDEASTCLSAGIVPSSTTARLIYLLTILARDMAAAG